MTARQDMMFSNQPKQQLEYAEQSTSLRITLHEQALDQMLILIILIEY